MRLTPAVQGTGQNTTAVIKDGKFSFVSGEEPTAGQYMFEVNLSQPLPPGIKLSPRTRMKPAATTSRYRKQLMIPAGGSSNFAIELTATDRFVATVASQPASGER